MGDEDDQYIQFSIIGTLCQIVLRWLLRKFNLLPSITAKTGSMLMLTAQLVFVFGYFDKNADSYMFTVLVIFMIHLVLGGLLVNILFAVIPQKLRDFLDSWEWVTTFVIFLIVLEPLRRHDNIANFWSQKFHFEEKSMAKTLHDAVKQKTDVGKIFKFGSEDFDPV